MIHFGWGLGVFCGVYVAYKSGAHLNPAVTLGLVASGDDLGGATGVKVLVYLSAQLIGAMIGATLAWVAYKKHDDDPDADADADAKPGTFATAPGKSDGNWDYAWVPIVGPAVGGVLAGLAAHGLNYV